MQNAEMVDAILDGQGNGLAAAYDRYAPALYGYCRSQLGEPAGAADAVQDTFIIAVGALGRLGEPARLRTWLYAVARNAIADRGRQRREPPMEAPDVASDEPGPAEQTEQGWLSWRVHRAVAELPDQERTLVELAYWSGLSQSEIAEYVGIPLGTVKTRTRSGLARLAEALEDLE